MPDAAQTKEPLFTARFIGMWLFAFVTFFSAFQLLPTIPLRIIELGGSVAQAGWFLTAYTLASAFAAPVNGHLADHIGRRRLLIIASILFIGFSLLYGVITYLPLLLVVGAIHGAIWSGILSSASAIMAGFIPESRRMQGFAYWGLSSNGAVAIAPAVGLWVFHHGWLMLCIEMACLSVLMTFGALMIRLTETRATLTNVSLRDAWDWDVIRVTTSLSAISIGYGGVTSYTVILAKERHIAPEGLYLSILAIAIIVIRVSTSHLGDRIGVRGVLIPSLSLVPISLVILAFATNRWEFAASAILFGFGFGAAYPAFATFVLANTDPARRARTFGSIVWAFDIGIGGGSFALGLLHDHAGFRAAFLTAAAISCLSIPLFLITSQPLIRRATLPG